jgi:hypothetical protein
MKATRRSALNPGNRSFIVDSAKQDGLADDLTQWYLNIIFDAGDRTIAHSWISLRPPDAHDLQKELTRFVFK